VVLFAGGKTYDLSLSDWTTGTRRPLGDSGLEAELVDVGVEQIPVEETVVKDPHVSLVIHHGSEAHPLLLSAAFPEILSRQDYSDKVFGTFWPGEPDKPTADVKTKSPSDAQTEVLPPRIDFFQGADQELYFRTWRAGEVKTLGPLKFGEEGGKVTAFRNTPDAVVLRFGDFQPAERPSYSAQALSFDKSDEQPHLRQAYVRLTVDGQSKEFWMPCASPDPIEKKTWTIPKSLERKIVAGKGRRVELTFAAESFQIGYTVHLNHAWRKLDPGTRQPSFYGSLIDLVPNALADKSSTAASAAKPYPEFDNVLITLNAPLDVADPALPGRSYRMFQSSMNGPYDPEQFDRKPGESVYLSGLTLNYDPGRGLTYVGCLLVVAGIFVAYFVRFAIPRRSSLPVPKTPQMVEAAEVGA